MPRKKNNCLMFALLCTLSATSQEYRFKPLYTTTISYHGKDNTYSWHTGKLSSRLGILTYIFDVDRKMVIFPVASFRDTTHVTSIERDERNRRLIFRAEPRGGNYLKQRWKAYIIQFDSDGTTPLYFQEGYNLQEYSSKDSMLTTYADNPRNFPFAVVSHGMKEDTTMGSGNRNEKIKALVEASFNNSNNRVEMRPGVVLWTKGKGRNAPVERFEVDSVSTMDDPRLSGVLVNCHIPGDAEGIRYVIGYLYKNGLHEVHINRLRFNRVLSATILQGY